MQAREVPAQILNGAEGQSQPAVEGFCGRAVEAAQIDLAEKVAVLLRQNANHNSVVHHGQCDQNSRSTPQPHLPQRSLDPGIFHGGRTLVWHHGQYFMNGIRSFRRHLRLRQRAV
jgi:hypothetical protein